MINKADNKRIYNMDISKATTKYKDDIVRLANLYNIKYSDSGVYDEEGGACDRCALKEMLNSSTRCTGICVYYADRSKFSGYEFRSYVFMTDDKNEERHFIDDVKKITHEYNELVTAIIAMSSCHM